jgi:glyoxylase-like metal-dependent hydrolase (beta-lactamase superfamily II)
MGWSSTLVSPPEGDMADCMASLRRLRALDAALLLPGHGHAVKDPATLLEWQIAHREAREAQILAALADGPADAGALAARLYADIDPRLLPAAARNVLAHLLALAAQGRARHAEPLTAQATFALS